MLRSEVRKFCEDMNIRIDGEDDLDRLVYLAAFFSKKERDRAREVIKMEADNWSGITKRAVNVAAQHMLEAI